MPISPNDVLLDLRMNSLPVTDASAWSRSGITHPGVSLYATSPNSVFHQGTLVTVPIAASTGFPIGSGDFTIEFDIYTNNADTSKTIIGAVSSTGTGWSVGITPTVDFVTGAKMAFYTHLNGTATLVAQTVYSSALSNTVDTYAIIRSGNTLTIYINGVSNVSVDVTGMNLDGIPTTITTGGINLPSNLGYANMTYMLANLRIVKGTALYTANYTRATAWGTLPTLVTVPTYPVTTNTFSLTLNPANFSKGVKTPVTTRSLVLTRNVVNTAVIRTTPVTTHSLSLTFNSANSSVVYEIPVTPFNLSLVSQLVSITEQSGVSITQLPLTMTLTNVGLTFGVTNIPVIVDTLSMIIGTNTVNVNRLNRVPIDTLLMNLTTSSVSTSTSLTNNIAALLTSIVMGQVGFTRGISIPTINYDTTFSLVFMQGSSHTTLSIDTLDVVLTNNNADVFNGNLKFYTSSPRIYI